MSEVSNSTPSEHAIACPSSAATPAGLIAFVAGRMSDFTSTASETVYTPSSSTPTLSGAATPSESANDMDFPIIRRARKQGDHSGYLNGMGIKGSFENRIPHTQERDLPGGANWVVQKFGGTSVGKFGRVIAEDIVA